MHRTPRSLHGGRARRATRTTSIEITGDNIAERTVYETVQRLLGVDGPVIEAAPEQEFVDPNAEYVESMSHPNPRSTGWSAG